MGNGKWSDQRMSLCHWGQAAPRPDLPIPRGSCWEASGVWPHPPVAPQKQQPRVSSPPAALAGEPPGRLGRDAHFPSLWGLLWQCGIMSAYMRVRSRVPEGGLGPEPMCTAVVCPMPSRSLGLSNTFDFPLKGEQMGRLGRSHGGASAFSAGRDLQVLGSSPASGSQLARQGAASPAACAHAPSAEQTGRHGPEPVSQGEAAECPWPGFPSRFCSSRRSWGGRGLKFSCQRSGTSFSLIGLWLETHLLSFRT